MKCHQVDGISKDESHSQRISVVHQLNLEEAESESGVGAGAEDLTSHPPCLLCDKNGALKSVDEYFVSFATNERRPPRTTPPKLIIVDISYEAM